MSTTCCCCKDNLEAVLAASRQALPEKVIRRIDEALAKGHPESELIAVLHTLQGEMGYLGRPQMDAVAQLMRVPTSTVTGVATFYHYFRLQKVGRFKISICTGTACYVNGASQVLAKLEEELGIRIGETSSDGLFSLEQARCLGMCGLAPVLMINEEVYERVSPDDIPGILKKHTDQAKQTPA